MKTAFYTAALGMKSQQQHMDTLANNMSNINTNGYKTMRTAFSDLLYTNMTHYAEQDGQDLKTGHGTKPAGTDLLFSQGSPMPTDRALDFCIVGNGLFGVINADNEQMYTRDGNFSIQLNGKNTNLITGNGDLVTDSKGKVLNVLTDENGNIDYEDLLSRIGIFKFDNPYALSPKGNNLFAENERTGKAVVDESSQLLQSYLEGSNVELAREMTDVMLTQKAFQFNAKVVQVADELEQTVNSLR